jgi:hypothetical protein
VNHKKLFRLYREEKLSRAAPRGPQTGHWNTRAPLMLVPLLSE